MHKYDEENFNSACSEINLAASSMSDIDSVCSSISIPGDFVGAADVSNVVTSISSNLSPKIDNYSTTFIGLKGILANPNIPTVVYDLDGNAVGLSTSEGYISLDSFKATETENGTYYKWMGGEGSNLNNACDIFIPNTDKITGTVIGFFKGDYAVTRFKNGEIDTDCIVLIPVGLDSDSTISQGKAKSLVEDAQNLATTFGADPNNLIVCGYSQAGDLAGALVKYNDPGTFSTAIFISTRYGVDTVTDPDVKVISVIGEAEVNNDNGKTVTKVFEDFAETHTNDVETYVVPATEEATRVNHYWVTATSLRTDIFDGQNLFDYAASKGSNNVSVGSATEKPDIAVNTISQEAPATIIAEIEEPVIKYEEATNTVNNNNLNIVNERLEALDKEITEPTVESVIEYEKETPTVERKSKIDIINERLETLDKEIIEPAAEPVVEYEEEKPEAIEEIEQAEEVKEPEITEEVDVTDTAKPSPSKPDPSPSKPDPKPSKPDPVKTTSEPVNILPDNKFSEEIPEITSGSLNEMEISTSHVRYEIGNISETEYSKYINNIKNAGYSLSEEGTYWIKGNYKITLEYNSNNLILSFNNISNI